MIPFCAYGFCEEVIDPVPGYRQVPRNGLRGGESSDELRSRICAIERDIGFSPHLSIAIQLISVLHRPLIVYAALRRVVRITAMDRKRRHNDYEDRRHDSQQQHHHHHKKSKHGNRRDDGGDNNNNTHSRPRPPKPSTAPYEQAIAALPPPTTTAALPPVPAYTPFTVPTDTLPPLPPILDPALATAPFRHKSTSAAYNRSASTSVTMTYEHLEFLGDAQLEHLASRLLFARFPHLTAGQQSQLRELLVKNETLAEYARAYGLDERVSVGDRERMEADAGKAGNKGFNKVLGDVFEAYVAAVILSHGDEGFAVAEKWMLGLWAPKLLEAAERERYWSPGVTLTHAGTAEEDGGEGWRKVYNPAAKAELQKLILSGRHVRLDYERYRDSVELKGERLGQSRHFIAVYLTGYGYERKLLGKGEGKNKVEAGNWAAQEALHGECKGVVEECAKILESKREERRRELEVAAEKEAAAEEQEGKGGGSVHG